MWTLGSASLLLWTRGLKSALRWRSWVHILHIKFSNGHGRFTGVKITESYETHRAGFIQRQELFEDLGRHEGGVEIVNIKVGEG